MNEELDSPPPQETDKKILEENFQKKVFNNMRIVKLEDVWWLLHPGETRSISLIDINQNQE